MLRVLVPVCLALALAACGGSATEPAGSPTPPSGPIRLVEMRVERKAPGEPAAPAPAPTEWRFDGAGEGTRGFAAGPGVGRLAVHEGQLVGEATDAVPLLHVENPGADGPHDYLHAVVIRARLSGGTRIGVRVQRDFERSFAEAAEDPELPSWGMVTPALPGNDLQTYTLTTPFTAFTRAQTRHVILRPTDAAGARFEIESLRLVYRNEHLTSLPSGPGWHGLAEIYREAILGRAGESFRYALVLPDRPRLDLALGTLGAGAVTFRADLRAGDGEPLRVLERTITTPDRWERAAVDLSDWAGRPVELSLSVTSELPGAPGLFGSPAVRRLGPPGNGRPQGVLFVLADTLRRDHLDVYGYGRETAPTLTRLAREGALFRNAISQGSWTKVSAPSLFTSLYQSSHGVRDFQTRLPDAATTLAEIFREAGYATLAFSSVPFTGRFNNMHQGYEVLHEATSVGIGETGRQSKTAREYVDRFLAWLEENREVPFFTLLHVFDPHDPFEPRSPYATLWADPDRRAEHVEQHEAVRKYIDHPLRREWGMPTVAELERAGFDPTAYIGYDLDWYDGSIRGMDAELKRLLGRLRELGLERDVLLVFTSDHGEEFHDHGDIIHGHSLYREILDVPLVFWAPGRVPAGRDVSRVVETLDVMPTLLELAGLPVPEGAQGRSLRPLLEGDGGDFAPRPAVAERLPRGGPGHRRAPHAQLDAVTAVEGRWKLIHNREREDERPEIQLFDRVADPREQRNVADEHPEAVERLLAELDAWRARADAVRLEQDAPDGDESMSAEELERLRALGYVQ